MRTTLNLDDAAVEAAMKVSEGRTKTEVVNEALRRFARAKRRRQLLDLRGKVEWTGNVDDLRNSDEDSGRHFGLVDFFNDMAVHRRKRSHT
jgi:Arc/MetJ family transcription regulator